MGIGVGVVSTREGDAQNRWEGREEGGEGGGREEGGEGGASEMGVGEGERLGRGR